MNHINNIAGMEYTVLGDAVNLAARLMANAPANGILIDESTKRHGWTDVRVQTRTPFPSRDGRIG